MFAKRHYEILANILRIVAVDIGLSKYPLVCKRIASELSTTNPKFDRAKFLKACDVHE